MLQYTPCARRVHVFGFSMLKWWSEWTSGWVRLQIALIFVWLLFFSLLKMCTITPTIQANWKLFCLNFLIFFFYYLFPLFIFLLIIVVVDFDVIIIFYWKMNDNIIYVGFSNQFCCGYSVKKIIIITLIVYICSLLLF